MYDSRQLSANQSTTSRQGYVVSHSDFPDDYTANIDSSLTITGLQPKQIVQIKFLSFNLYYNSRYPDCNYDFLEIHGATEGIITFCSNPDYQPPLDEWYSIPTDEYTITFRFHTNYDDSTVRAGFYFQFKGTVIFQHWFTAFVSFGVKDTAEAIMTYAAQRSHPWNLSPLKIGLTTQLSKYFKPINTD